jgi:hypothetical protein
MDRKEFLRGCAGGLCACAAAACLPEAAVAAETPKPEDWRLPFVKQRFAKLLQTMSQKMGSQGASETLQAMGDFCSSQRDEITNKFRGKADEFGKFITQQGSTVSHDAGRNVYTVAYDPKGACPCPFAGEAGKTPSVMCECSIGWTRHTWGIVLDREVKVELKEAFLRGGKRCIFEIQVLEA